MYVAGPISGDPFGCVAQAMAVFGPLRHVGVIPFMPQLSVIGEMVAVQGYEAWMDYDLDVIGRCDGLVRLPGVSPGADLEVAVAIEAGLPVFRLDGPDDREMLIVVAAWAADVTAGRSAA